MRPFYIQNKINSLITKKGGWVFEIKNEKNHIEIKSFREILEQLDDRDLQIIAQLERIPLLETREYITGKHIWGSKTTSFKRLK